MLTFCENNIVEFSSFSVQFVTCVLLNELKLVYLYINAKCCFDKTKLMWTITVVNFSGPKTSSHFCVRKKCDLLHICLYVCDN